MLCKKKNNRIEGVPVYCKKSSLHLSGRNNKIIFGKNCNIVNCRIKLPLPHLSVVKVKSSALVSSRSVYSVRLKVIFQCVSLKPKINLVLR